MHAAKNSWPDFFDSALDLLYPRKCPLCGLLADSSPCVTCEGEMEPAEPFVVQEREGPLDFRASIYLYEGRAGQAVRRLKYSRSTSLGVFMAGQISNGANRLGPVGEIVPVPIHWTRFCSRGFNQAEMLCQGMAARTDLLARTRATRPQVGLNREARLRNLAGAFAVRADVRGMEILLVDDVVTSGQTARECARVLKEAGAREVGIIAFCGEASAELYQEEPSTRP